MTTKRDHLDAVQAQIRGISGLAIPDDHIYAGQLHEKMPDNCIAMREYGGPGTDKFFQDDESIQHPRVQVHIRHPDRHKAKEDADTVWAALHLATPAPYDHFECLQDTPIGAGQDKDGRYRWSVNVELWICE